MTEVSRCISASILSANFLRLENEIERLIQSGIKIFHCDVMDGVFVPNISFGHEVVRQIYLKFKDQITLDTHLMIEKPEKFIDFFLQYSQMVSFHFEATTKHFDIFEKVNIINKANQNGILKKIGMAIKPATQLREIQNLIPFLDYVLVMTVEPGFSGQKFIESQLEKIKEISDFIKKNQLKTQIQVDGGINEENITLCRASGASIFAMASYIFKSPNLTESVNKLEGLLEKQ